MAVAPSMVTHDEAAATVLSTCPESLRCRRMSFACPASTAVSNVTATVARGWTEVAPLAGVKEDVEGAAMAV